MPYCLNKHFRQQTTKHQAEMYQHQIKVKNQYEGLKIYSINIDHTRTF